jgi:hypothetical protein
MPACPVQDTALREKQNGSLHMHLDPVLHMLILNNGSPSVQDTVRFQMGVTLDKQATPKGNWNLRKSDSEE